MSARKLDMKIFATIAMLLALVSNAYACNPFGWVLVKQGSLGIGETVCTYEKNGYQVSIIVKGFCPLNPC